MKTMGMCTLASYLLSRTIVPMIAKYLLRGDQGKPGDAPSGNPLVRLQKRFEEAFERFRHSFRGVLELCLHHRRIFLIAFFTFCLGSLAILIPWLGQDFFPAVDSGTFKLHLRAPTGMRIEETVAFPSARKVCCTEFCGLELGSGASGRERLPVSRPAVCC